MSSESLSANGEQPPIGFFESVAAGGLLKGWSAGNDLQTTQRINRLMAEFHEARVPANRNEQLSLTQELGRLASSNGADVRGDVLL